MPLMTRSGHQIRDRGTGNRLRLLLLFSSAGSRDLLMKCAQCRTRYSAADAQPAPGGSSAPGVLLGLAVVFICSTAIAFVLHALYVKWVGVGLSVFVAMQIPMAWAACRSKAGLAKQGGGACPKCRTENPVRLWSL